MKKYKRISCSFMPDGAMASLKNDAVVSAEMNARLQDFLKKEKAKEHRIINVETSVIPSIASTPGYLLVCLHLEYQV